MSSTRAGSSIILAARSDRRDDCGHFACSACKVHGKIIPERRYQPAGQRAALGRKDANLALAAGEAVGVRLPRLVGAVAHGEGEHDWAVMANDQAPERAFLIFKTTPCTVAPFYRALQFDLRSRHLNARHNRASFYMIFEAEVSV